MEQQFRIVLWMFLLIFSVYVQAKPLPDELGAKYLLSLTCEHNFTLTSPTNVKRECSTAAMKHFMQGLENAKSKCNNTEERIEDSMEHLKQYKLLPQNNQMTAECSWENEDSRKQFGGFVADLEVFAKLLQIWDNMNTMGN